MAEDLILRKAEEFNRTEVIALEGWLVAAQAGEPAKARAILRTGLLAEHYRSLLSEDPAEIPVEQSDQLIELLREFDRALQQIGGPPAPYP